jgi:hypothetical protein
MERRAMAAPVARRLVLDSERLAPMLDLDA